ncbi:MAG: gamma-glutamyltransferase [Alphaproteobacteria bacterium]|nr:gamma-glutamyltransferase [Alphaproteobacteria bacterium]
MTRTCTHGVVAAGHQATATAAAEILQDGGNAFDAVIAGLFAACVPEVVLASLGGGGFLMAHVADRNTTHLYDFFVDTPRRKRPVAEQDFRTIVVDFGTQTQEFQIGVGASATPGMVPGLFAVHRDLARMPMQRLVEPAIRVARDGVEMNAYQSYLFSIIPEILSGDPRAAKWFAKNGSVLGKGDQLKNPTLAETLSELAEDGEAVFVDGPIGQEIVRQSREHGGHLTSDDLKRYHVQRRQPLMQDFLGARVALNPAPAASGPLISFSLALLSALQNDVRQSPVSLADVMVRTNHVRAGLEDASSGLGDRLVQRHLEEMRKHTLAPRGTTHISVIDKAGNVAAATVSNGEGNGRMVGDFGFMLNNMLGEEDLNPNGFHTWQPATRMSTMMAPTIVREADGSLTALGSGGSNRIRSAVLQVICGLVDRGLAAEAAVTAPRLHVEKCGHLSFEGQFSNACQEALRAAYPDARVWPEPNMFFGGVHLARQNRDGSFEGVGDRRREGVALFV